MENPALQCTFWGPRTTNNVIKFSANFSINDLLSKNLHSALEFTVTNLSLKSILKIKRQGSKFTYSRKKTSV